MLDENKNQVNQLNRKIELLEKAFNDERSARKNLEARLDGVDQHRYDSYKELISALLQANNRQIQLQVLSNLGALYAKANSTAEMLTAFINEISQLLEQANVMLFDYKNPAHTIAYQLDNQQHVLVKLCKHRIDLRDFVCQIGTEDGQWQRFTEKLFSHNALTGLLKHDYQIVFSYQRLKNRKNIVVIDLPHYCYSKELKQTLNTAGQQFIAAIQKSATEEKLAKNYQQLQQTLVKLTSTQKQLIHSEKMASVGQLAAGIAHEINNPIGYIKSNLSVLEDYILTYNKALKSVEPHLPANDELNFVKDDIDTLISSCASGVDRVAEIVSNLSSFARKEEADELRIVNLNTVLDESVKVAWSNIKYNCDVEVIADEQLPYITGHKGELQQVFINLLVNAVHSINEQGKIIIKTWFDTKVHVSISDDGCGMDEETLNKVFEPFFTTKPEGKGTGLGLSVSYAIIEHHQGEIDVTSKVNQGTTFKLSFPISQQT